ncbi:MAG: hypothetical protein JNM84_22730 [Planctomycetes bacterium]|nr:hypothetical protein [Planctomycetota bacterium]
MLDLLRASALAAALAFAATSCSTPPVASDRDAAIDAELAFEEELEVGDEDSGGGATLAAALLGGATYDVALKGTSETFDGSKFPFTGVGTMTIDTGTGLLTFQFQLSNGLSFSGDGIAAVTEKNRIFASVDLESGTTSFLGVPLGVIEGVAVIDGKGKSDGSSFSAKMTAAVPNRLGAPPQGFVLSKMSAKGVRRVVG